MKQVAFNGAKRARIRLMKRRRRSVRKRDRNGSPATQDGSGGKPIVKKKTTPSGSKNRVPAAPVAGPLKSPAPLNLADPPPRKCELPHNRGSLFPVGALAQVRATPLRFTPADFALVGPDDLMGVIRFQHPRKISPVLIRTQLRPSPSESWPEQIFRIDRIEPASSSGGCAPFVLYYSRDYRRAGHRQQEGVDPPRKPLPRKTIPADLRSLARGHTELCIKVLAGIVSQEASQRRRGCRRQASCWIVAGDVRLKSTTARIVDLFGLSSGRSLMSIKKSRCCLSMKH